MSNNRDNRGTHPHSQDNLIKRWEGHEKKIRRNYTILEQTAEWLSEKGNASQYIDELVARDRNGELPTASSKVPDSEIKLMREELNKVATILEQLSEESQQQTEKIIKAQEILKSALPLPANKGGAIKDKVRQALELFS